MTEICRARSFLLFFFFNDTATTEIYTLSLHDALPIFPGNLFFPFFFLFVNINSKQNRLNMKYPWPICHNEKSVDRKSTRLNSSHANISYAVFCLKKKTNIFLALLSSQQTQSHAPSLVT